MTIVSGKLLYSIVNNLDAIESGENAPKMSLYSGHETNIAALSQTLGIFKPHVPEYSSAVIIELYERSSQYYVKVKKSN